jgi:hypothetical protein
VHPVGAARLDEVGAVVEDEERAVRLACRAERPGRGDERLVRERLVAELDDVDLTTQGRVEQRTWILAMRTGLEDEVEP